ncbi:glycosyltransferase family 4 protein [Rhodocytophaga aerolata]|uniref:Glycosyltransferase family 4 protein n=1 Tax=Rhodocytophaga aerolata TaxID=455078 RepID=A0ABT8RG76_9BACT|nr:glycosyltransferase family 4 protein [Rhodocytophaga aerolata]MDO1450148.1 glycosyltransferase family 4 protein [Rhodocytophaga aerolata]
MKILFIHNTYQQRGGEDVIFENESELMESHGHSVERLLFDNHQIKTGLDKFLTGVKSLYNFESAKIVEAVIKNFSPDLIHVHNLFPIASPSILYVADKYKIPVVLSIHNYRLICPSATLLHTGKIYEKSIHSIFPLDAIVKGVYRGSKIQTASAVLMTGTHKLLGTWKNKVTRYIVMSQFAKNKFLDSSLNVAEEKWSIKPNFSPDMGVGDTARENSFLFIGRLTAEKGIETLLEAARITGFNLEILGDGPMREVVENYASQHQNIVYAGFKQKQEIIQALKKCKALLFPSVWYEGFPMTILEAFSVGTPVISSKLGAMVEMIEDQGNGLHVKPGDVEDLVEKMRLLTTQPDLARILGKNARCTYEDKYAPEKNYEQLLAIYLQVIEAKKQMKYEAV